MLSSRLAAPCLLALAASASAQWSDDFDSYPLGTKLPGNGGWEEWNQNTAGSQTRVQDLAAGAAVRSAPHSIWVRGASDTIYDWGANQPGIYTSGQWTFCGFLYKPVTTTGFAMNIPQFLVMLSRYAHNSSAATNWSVQVDFSPLTGNYTIATATATYSGPCVFDRWVEVRAEIDLDADQVELFYDGATTGVTYPWNGGVSGFGTGSDEIATLDLYANGSMNPLSRVYWDDLSLQPGFGGCGDTCTAAAPVSYCTPGTSEKGCQARISAVGTPSPTAGSGFVVSVQGAPTNTAGIFFYGQNGRQANPWVGGGSFQCVQPPVLRSEVVVSSGGPTDCDGVASLDLNARWCTTGACSKPLQAPVPGLPLQVQFYYADPDLALAPYALSDALEVDVCP